MTSSPSSRPPGTLEWYYAVSGRRQGPVTRQVMQEMLASGQLPPNTPVWAPSMPQWTSAEACGLLGGSPPPPAPQACAPPPGQYYHPPPPDVGVGSMIPSRNVPALVGYYLGVFSLIPCMGLLLAIPAIVVGLFGIRKATRFPQCRGKGHAITALALGAATVVLHAGAMILMGAYAD